MVPDYNPVDDISIGTEEHTGASEEPGNGALDSSGHRWKYGIAAGCAVLLGILIFQISYHFVLKPQDTVAEPEEPVLLAKPQFSAASGQYSYSLRLTISHEQRNDGVIYYTTDGTTPGVDSTIYNSPIEIGEGKTVLRAVFIRSDGIQSEEADGTYEVIFDYPDEPVFSADSGAYTGGFYVSIYAEEDCRIYYTTNGEEPGYDSKLYRGPVYIPAGLTVLQAVAVDEEGGMSGIVEAIYNVSEIPAPVEEVPEQSPEEEAVIP